MKYEKKADKVIIYPEGRISSSNTADLRDDINKIISENPDLEPVLDASGLLYISSAGLRVLLQISKNQDKKLKIINVSPDVYEIFEITGFTEILDVKKRLREFSIDGCEIVGKGAIGTVYRVDEDTIVKVYEIPDALPMIENEQRRAKQAFLKGVPTAISYDVVKVGDKYGSVFEMLKASTYNDILADNPEEVDEIARQYALLLKQIHSVTTDEGELPLAKEVFLKYLDDLNDVIPKELNDKLRELLLKMPIDLHLIHGDMNMKNVMVSDGEALLIDMDTLCTGDPVFDLMGMCVSYQLYGEDEPDNTREFFGLEQEVCDKVWDKTVKYYFDGFSEEQLDLAEKKIRIIASIRFLYLVGVMNIGKSELKQIRIDHTVSRLSELVAQTNSLNVRE